MESRARRNVVLVAVVSMMVVGAFATTATAVPPKSFAADITQCASAGATSFTFTVTLRNETSTQMLGSANVTAPTGFTIAPPTPDGSTVELRNLNVPPGGSTSATFQATTPALAPPPATNAYTWTIIAKQSNDYNGSPGNNLTFDAGHSHLTTYVGTCVLNFVTQPATTKTGANITSQQANPSGNPVQAEVLSGVGGSRITTFTGSVSLSIKTGPGPLSGTTAVNAVNGLATFGNEANPPGFSIRTPALGYQLTAGSDPGISPADSSTFDIADDAVICANSNPNNPATWCTGNASKGGVSVKVQGPATVNGNILLVALDVESTPDCPGYTLLGGTPTVTFSVTGPSYRIVTIVVPVSLATRPASQDLVCYRSETATFTNRAGDLVPVGGSGLLPDCKSKTPLSAPCQFPTTVDKLTGDHTVSFRAPTGSTRGHT